MSATNTRIRELFDRRADGTITPKEEYELAQYITAPGNRAAIEQIMEEMWDNGSMRPLATNSTSDFTTKNSTLHTIDELADHTLAYPGLKGRSPGRRTMLFRIAATVLCFALAGAATYYYYKDAATRDVFYAQETPGRSNDPKAIILPDGSTVLLKEGSRLVFSRSFEGDSTRSVFLEGEGYFDIEHDDAKPFIVHTGTVQTVVLGTAFVIKAYKNDPQITVTVSRGKVRVTDELRVIGTLTKNQQITFDKENHVTDRNDMASDSTLAWTRQDMYFDDVTFAQAASRISERFGVGIRFADERTSNCKFTATFVEGESFARVMEVICAFNHASYHQTDAGEFLIEGPGC